MRRNRSRSSAILSSPFTLILALIVLFFLGRAALSIHAKSSQTLTKLTEEQTNLAKLKANEAKVASQLAHVSTEEGVKAEIREKYHAVEPGESVAVIVDSNQTAAAGTIQSTTTEKRGFWRRLLGFFGM